MVAGQQQGWQVLVALLRGLVGGAPHGGFLERAIPAFDRALGPRVGRLGAAVLDARRAADAVKAVPAGEPLVRLPGAWDALIGEHRRRCVGHGRQHPAPQLRRPQARGARRQFGEGPLAGALHGPEPVPASRPGLPLGNIHGQLPNGRGLDLLFGRALALLCSGQAAEAVALTEAGQGLDAAPPAGKRVRRGIVAGRA